MATGVAEIAYRPIRIGFLVRKGRRDDLLAAIRLNTVLWGGAFNPIFEVTRSERNTDSVIRSLPTDTLHPVVDSAPLGRAAERHQEQQWPRFGSLIHGGDEPWVAAVDVRPALARIRASREPTGSPLEYGLPRWSDDDPFALVYAATFGDLAGADVLVPGISRAFSEGTGTSDLMDADAAAVRVHDFAFPLDVTRTALPHGPAGEYSFESWDGVFVGDARAAGDACAYWNLRSQGLNTLFWDTNTGGPFAAAVIADAAAAESHDLDPNTPASWYPCYFSSVPEGLQDGDDPIPADLRSMLEPHLRPVPRWATSDIPRERAWRYRATESQQTIVHGEDLGGGRSRVLVPLPPSPLPSSPGRGERLQSWVVVVSAFADRGYHGTLRLPPLPDLNRWYEWELGAAHSVRVEHGAVGIVTGRYSASLDLFSIPHDRLLIRVLERAGIAAARNVSGESARHLIAQLGGWNALRVLRIPGVRRLLSRNDALTGLSRQQARDAIRDEGSFEAADPFYVAGRRLETPDEVFDFLLSRRVFLPGLEISCPQCLHSTFFPAGEIADLVRCPKCGHEFLLAPSLRGDRWRYRISGLLENRAHRIATRQPESQPEAIPVLLTLLRLSEEAATPEGDVLLEANHDLSGATIASCESDFLALVWGDGHEQTQPHILVGECKGQGQVEQEDIDKMGQVVDEAQRSGLRANMLFSTTRPSFTDDELARFRAYVDAQVAPHPLLLQPPILLTADDLDHGPYSGTRPTRQTSWQHGAFGSLVETSRTTYFSDSEES